MISNVPGSTFLIDTTAPAAATGGASGGGATLAEDAAPDATGAVGATASLCAC